MFWVNVLSHMRMERFRILCIFRNASMSQDTSADLSMLSSSSKTNGTNEASLLLLSNPATANKDKKLWAGNRAATTAGSHCAFTPKAENQVIISFRKWP